MNILEQNLMWMSWNIFLAGLGVVFALWFVLAKSRLWKVIAGLMWFLFVPNTIYMITDLVHLPEQWWRVSSNDRWILVGQYTVLMSLAVLTYLKSMDWFQEGLFMDFRWSKSYVVQGLRRRQQAVVLLLNLLISYGVVMGRVMRTNSWHVFTQPLRALGDVVRVMQQNNVWWMVILMWMVMNGLYLGWRSAKAQRQF